MPAVYAILGASAERPDLHVSATGFATPSRRRALECPTGVLVTRKARSEPPTCDTYSYHGSGTLILACMGTIRPARTAQSSCPIHSVPDLAGTAALRACIGSSPDRNWSRWKAPRRTSGAGDTARGYT